MEQTSELPGALFRFRNNLVNVFPCVNPVEDVKEPFQEGDIDLFKVNYSAFCQHSEVWKSYFNLKPDMMNLLTSSTLRSEFRCRDEYISITIRYPVFEQQSRTFQIYSASLLILKDKLLLLQPDSDKNLFEPLLNRVIIGDVVFKKKNIPAMTIIMANEIFRVYTASMEVFGDVLNKLEEDIMDRDHKTVFMMTALVRKQNIFLQQTILPLKEMIFNMRHAESDLVTPELDNSLHILSDQIQRIIDSAGMLSQINSGLLDIYANSQANHMNDIMRTLTVFSVLTLPITVISGFYGMNFIFLPGLKWEYAVITTIIVMVILILLIWWFCKRKNII